MNARLGVGGSISQSLKQSEELKIATKVPKIFKDYENIVSTELFKDQNQLIQINQRRAQTALTLKDKVANLTKSTKN